METKNLKNQKEAAKFLGVSDTTLRTLTKSGQVKCIKFGGRVYYDDTELQKLLKKRAKAEDKKAVESIEAPKEVSEPVQEVKAQEIEAKEDESELLHIEDLIASTLSEEERIKREKMRQFNDIVNRNPPKSWVKVLEGEKTLDGREVLDLPIEKVELLLTRIFGEWHTEIVEVKQIFKESVSVSVKVNYLDVFGVWRYVSGVGAVHVGAEPNVQNRVPVAKALAIKNACKEIGRVFGRDLNRNIVEVAKPRESAIIAEYRQRISEAKDFVQLEEIKSNVAELNNRELTNLFNDKEFQLLN